MDTYALRAILIVLVFLVLGRPVARFAYRKTANLKHPIAYYYALGSCIIVALLCLIALSGCALPRVETPQPTPPTAIYKDDFSKDKVAGKTFCNQEKNVPIIVLDSFWIKTPEFKPILAHELRHAKNAWYFPGGCISWLAKYNKDVNFRYRQEVEAECASIAQTRTDKENYIRELVRYVMSRQKRFGPRIEEAVEMYVRQICQKEILDFRRTTKE